MKYPKHLFVSFIVFTLLVAVYQTNAQSTKEVFFNAGAAIPSKPEVFSDYWKMGFNVGGGVGFSISKNTTLSGSIDYSSFGIDEDGVLKSNGLSNTGVSISGGAASILTIMGNAKILLTSDASNIAPYIVGGLGFFNISTNDIKIAYMGDVDVLEGSSELAFSLLLGAGFQFPIGNSSIFLEGNYHIGFTEGSSTAFFPIKVGLRMKI